jgi:hypothetical protein
MTTTGAAWYAVIDAAQDTQLHPLATGCRDVQCLVAGDVAPVLARTLPYLVALHPDEPLLERWRTAGAGRGWGIMLESALSRDQLRLRLKTFLNARLPDGAVVWFRFYDPLVLRALFRVSTPAELAPWFRDIRQFVVEGDTPGLWTRFGFDGGRLAEEAATATGG